MRREWKRDEEKKRRNKSLSIQEYLEGWGVCTADSRRQAEAQDDEGEEEKKKTL